MLKRLLILLAIAALAATAGACGSSEQDSSAQKDEPAKAEAGGTGTDAKANASAGAPAKEPTAIETVRVAYKETASEQTARTSFEVTMIGPEIDPEGSGRSAPMGMTMTGRGVTDFSGARSALTMRMPGMDAMEVRQIGAVSYTKMPKEFLAGMPGAKPWMKVDVGAMAGQQYGAGLGQMQGGPASDPTAQLEYLRGVSDSVEKVGTEKVRGVQTTRYEASIDMEKALAEQGGEAQKAYDELVRQTGMREVPVQTWLDDQNRVRRFAMTMTMTPPEGQASPGIPEGGKMRMDMVAEYYDFGTPVNVQAPPPDQTADAQKMMSAQQTPAA